MKNNDIKWQISGRLLEFKISFFSLIFDIEESSFFNYYCYFSSVFNFNYNCVMEVTFHSFAFICVQGYSGEGCL